MATANVSTMEGWASEQSRPVLHDVFFYFTCPMYLENNPIYLFIRTHTANLEMKTEIGYNITKCSQMEMPIHVRFHSPILVFPNTQKR